MHKLFAIFTQFTFGFMSIILLAISSTNGANATFGQYATLLVLSQFIGSFAFSYYSVPMAVNLSISKNSQPNERNNFLFAAVRSYTIAMAIAILFISLLFFTPANSKINISLLYQVALLSASIAMREITTQYANISSNSKKLFVPTLIAITISLTATILLTKEQNFLPHLLYTLSAANMTFCVTFLTREAIKTRKWKIDRNLKYRTASWTELGTNFAYGLRTNTPIILSGAFFSLETSAAIAIARIPISAALVSIGPITQLTYPEIFKSTQNQKQITLKEKKTIAINLLIVTLLGIIGTIAYHAFLIATNAPNLPSLTLELCWALTAASAAIRAIFVIGNHSNGLFMGTMLINIKFTMVSMLIAIIASYIGSVPLLVASTAIADILIVFQLLKLRKS